jgi:predicted Rossmann fold flavoprotein
LTPAAVRARFHELGVPTVEEPALEKVFPASQRAVDVRDALVRRARGADVRHGARVLEVRPEGGRWRVRSAEAEVVATSVILSAGGRSYPATGTTGDGYAWLEALGLCVVPTVPALVPVTSPAAWARELTGVAFQEVEARLLDGAGKVLGRRARPVVFTHTGLSGPGAMDLAAPIARAARAGAVAGWSIALDLLPATPEDALRTQLLAAVPGSAPLPRMLRGAIPPRVLAAVCAQAGVPGDVPPVHTLDRGRRNRLVDALKGLRVPVDGTLGWDKAEVTAGGLALEEVNPSTLEVRRHPGLYVVGELLDLHGPIGGLNFQAAFATAEVAATRA